MKKKKCVKGNSCGSSCISSLKVCRKIYPPKVSGVLDKKAENKVPQDKEALKKELKRREDLLKKKLGKENYEKIKYRVAFALGEKSYSSVSMRVPLEVLDSIAEDGFKNQFETGSSRGLLTGDLRKKVEKESLFIPEASSGSNRPLYGYLSKGDYEENMGDSVSLYGDVQIKFKQSIRDRTTLTGGDSMMEGDFVGSKPTSKDFSLSSLFSFKGGKIEESEAFNVKKVSEGLSSDMGSLSKMLNHLGTQYFEVQFDGESRPKLSDIQEVVVPYGKSLPPRFKKEMETLGVKVVQRNQV